MRRATITIDAEPADELDVFVASLAARPSLASIVQAALHRFPIEEDAGIDAPLLAQVIRHGPAIREITREHGASNVRLFGSVARGEETEHSDIDLLVTLETGRTLFDLARMKRRLEALLDSAVDVVPDMGLNDGLREEIEVEAIRL